VPLLVLFPPLPVSEEEEEEEEKPLAGSSWEGLQNNIIVWKTSRLS